MTLPFKQPWQLCEQTRKHALTFSDAVDYSQGMSLSAGPSLVDASRWISVSFSLQLQLAAVQQDVELDEPKAAHLLPTAHMGLSRDGVLRLRANPAELMFRLLNVDIALAAIRINEEEDWRRISR